MAQTEVDLEVLKVVVNKLNETLDKIVESTNTVSRLLAVHADKIQHLEKDHEDTNKEIKDLYTKMEHNTKEILEELKDMEERIEYRIDETKDLSSEQHKSLSDKVDRLDSRIQELEKWRWYVAGGLGLLAFLVSKSELFSGFLKH